MADPAITDRVREFVFRYIDSVEQLNVLLLLASQPVQWWSAAAVNNELRSNLSSIENRLKLMQHSGIIQINDNQPLEYRLRPDPELETTVRELADSYKVRPHRIMELIFSPLKRARAFADAFNVYDGKKKEDENG